MLSGTYRNFTSVYRSFMTAGKSHESYGRPTSHPSNRPGAQGCGRAEAPFIEEAFSKCSRTAATGELRDGRLRRGVNTVYADTPFWLSIQGDEEDFLGKVHAEAVHSIEVDHRGKARSCPANPAEVHERHALLHHAQGHDPEHRITKTRHGPRRRPYLLFSRKYFRRYS